MPLPNQQGSKAGLVTALVIFVILFVVSAIFAIYFQTQWTAEQQSHKTDLAKMNKVVDPSKIDSSLTGLATQKQSAVDVLMSRSDSLITEMTGAVTDSAAALKAADTAMADADAALTRAQQKVSVIPVQLKSPPAQSNLIQTINLLNQQIGVLADQVVTEHDAQTAAETLAQTAKSDADKTSAAAQGKVDEANKARDQAVADAAQKEKEHALQMAETQQRAADQLNVYSKANQVITVNLQAANQKLAEKDKENTALKDHLARFRINAKESVVRQSDGKIARIADANTVFIDIGHDQGVTPGLTFEVYDPNKGIPPLGDGQREDDLPVGMASLEVTHVLADSSECRVVRTSTGAALVPGDAIMNLVFDPHTKYKFVVFGSFDLNQTGTPNAADAEVIKRLVSQWGGQIQPADQINTDTDFLVLGTEPVVTELSDDDKADPQKVKQHDDAQAALDAYEAERQKAIEFGIPILNQNRFLYYTGYFDLAKQ